MKEALPDWEGHSLEAVTFLAGLVAHFRYNSDILASRGRLT